MQDGRAFVLLSGLTRLAFAAMQMPFQGAVFPAIVPSITFRPLFE